MGWFVPPPAPVSSVQLKDHPTPKLSQAEGSKVNVEVRERRAANQETEPCQLIIPQPITV